MNLYDAHNHLQDDRLADNIERIAHEVRSAGILRMVVNGASQADWPAVAELAARFDFVLPSFGCHPWYIKERSQDWEVELERYLDSIPSAVGEIGLDRWIKDHDLDDQAEVFTRQLRLAARRNVPASIHCLQAWGKLEEILRREPRPACGFVLHSFGGPVEMVPGLAELGAYFSLPGYFALERKSRQRETLKQVPRDRLLIETDAPDQNLPPERVKFPLPDGPDGRPVNHPANLVAVYEFAAELFQMELSSLAQQVEANFQRIFGGAPRRP